MRRNLYRAAHCRCYRFPNGRPRTQTGRTRLLERSKTASPYRSRRALCRFTRIAFCLSDDQNRAAIYGLGVCRQRLFDLRPRDTRFARRTTKDKLGKLSHHSHAKQKRPQPQPRNQRRHRTFRSNPANINDILKQLSVRFVPSPTPTGQAMRLRCFHRSETVYLHADKVYTNLVHCEFKSCVLRVFSLSSLC